MTTEWVYKYDDAGNRTGLIEVPMKTDNTDDMGYGEFYTWYAKIEKAVVKRSRWASVNTSISEFDLMVLKLELEALRYTEPNGFQPSIRRKEVIDMYFTEAGDKKYTKTTINTQNIQWIYGYISMHMSMKRMFMSTGDIKYTLHDISMAHHAAEKQDKIVEVRVSESLRHRILKIA